MRSLFWISLVFALTGAQAADVAPAMAKVRRGDYTAVTHLSVTAADVPALTPLLMDANTDVARESMTLLERIGGPQACAAMVRALTSASADMRERTANTMYRRCQRPQVENVVGWEPALHQSVRMGNTAASAILLLRHFANDGNRQFLLQLLKADAAPVKLAAWSTPVPQVLAAAVAAVSVGLAQAQTRLVQGLDDVASAEFLASTLPDVTDLVALHSLLPLLDNQQTVRAGVPSGASPQRRVCDLALDAFVDRLSLRPSFSLRAGGRYITAEFDEVKRLASIATTKP
jgi:hypothetical protein